MSQQHGAQALAADARASGSGPDQGRPLIVLGDKTDHGGVVITASTNTFSNERPVARVGDSVTCPLRGHGVTTIVSGSPAMHIDGISVARHGDRTACGAVLLSSQIASSTL